MPAVFEHAAKESLIQRSNWFINSDHIVPASRCFTNRNWFVICFPKIRRLLSYAAYFFWLSHSMFRQQSMWDHLATNWTEDRSVEPPDRHPTFVQVHVSHLHLGSLQKRLGSKGDLGDEIACGYQAWCVSGSCSKLLRHPHPRPDFVLVIGRSGCKLNICMQPTCFARRSTTKHEKGRGYKFWIPKRHTFSIDVTREPSHDRENSNIRCPP